MIFSEKLITLRKKAGLSQEDIAEKLDITRQAVYKWENGQSMPDIEKLKILSKLFDVSLDNLLDDKQDIKSNESQPQKPLFGTVSILPGTPGSVDPNKDHTSYSKKEERLLFTKKALTIILYVIGGICAFIGIISLTYLNFPVALGFIIGGAVAFLGGYLIREFLFQDIETCCSSFYRKKAEAEEKLKNSGYSYTMIQHDLLVWFFYDSKRKAFGFYFFGEECFVCPIQNYVDFKCIPYGGGIRHGTPNSNVGFVLGSSGVNGVYVNSSPTYMSGAANHFDFTLTYFDVVGNDKKYKFSLSSSRSYLLNFIKNPEGYQMMEDSISHETLSKYEEIKTKLDLEKRKFDKFMNN